MLQQKTLLPHKFPHYTLQHYTLHKLKQHSWQAKHTTDATGKCQHSKSFADSFHGWFTGASSSSSSTTTQPYSPYQGSPSTSLFAGIPRSIQCCKPLRTVSRGLLALAIHRPRIYSSKRSKQGVWYAYINTVLKLHCAEDLCNCPSATCATQEGPLWLLITCSPAFCASGRQQPCSCCQQVSE